jgi:hypothetical protein
MDGELEIPERAWDAAAESNKIGGNSTDAIQVAAPIVVAAAYRARAQECNCLDDAELLNCAADELDPGGVS